LKKRLVIEQQPDKQEQYRNSLNLETPKFALTEYEVGRAQALAEYHAKFASAQRKVRDFRDDILKGRLLTPEEADAFVTSVAICFASSFGFRRYGVPFIGHKATLVKEETVSEQGEFYQQISCYIEPSSESMKQPVTVRFPVEERKWLDWVNKDGSFQQIMYCEDSLLDDLANLGESLAQEFGCVQQVAILFVLTGLPLVVQPISVGATVEDSYGVYRYHRGTITLKIEPWVSADSVLRTYRQLQQQLFGHPNHPIRSERLLELFRFVTHEMQIVRNSEKYWDHEVVRPTWQELLDRWNQAHPSNIQYPHLSNFVRDYHRVKLSILLPAYTSLR